MGQQQSNPSNSVAPSVPQTASQPFSINPTQTKPKEKEKVVSQKPSNENLNNTNIENKSSNTTVVKSTSNTKLEKSTSFEGLIATNKLPNVGDWMSSWGTPSSETPPPVIPKKSESKTKQKPKPEELYYNLESLQGKILPPPPPPK